MKYLDKLFDFVGIQKEGWKRIVTTILKKGISNKIYTVQSSDKKKFEKEVNLFLELGCELHEKGYEVLKKDDGVVYSQVVVINPNKSDVDFYDNGQISHLVNLNINGKRVGKYTSWDEKGQKKEESNFKDGKQDGKQTRWYFNGQKSRELTYKDDELDGFWTEWYKNGQKRSDGTWKDGKEDGLWIYWYENGQKEFEGSYKEGKQDGKWTYYNEDGTVKVK